MPPTSRPAPTVSTHRSAQPPAARRGLRHCLALLALGLMGGGAMANPADRSTVLRAAGLEEREGRWHLPDCATPVKPDIEWHELSGAAPAEAVVFLEASRCLPGHRGGSLRLLADRGEGSWQPLTDWQAGVELVPQAGRSEGWRDIGIATSGGCMPLFRWQAGSYRVQGQKAIQPGGCALRE